jgi:TonB family protein
MNMMKYFLLPQLTVPHGRIFWLIPILLLSLFSRVGNAEPDVEEEIETLNVIKITGSSVEPMPKDLNFPIPEISTSELLSLTRNISLPDLQLIKPIPTQINILLDQTAQTRNLHTPVKPLKTERPLYPRQAREQGWHGRVILRLRILADGTVESAAIQESSGHQLLDDNAINTATQWTFHPAKNGGFPVATTVDIPIQFDLVQ